MADKKTGSCANASQKKAIAHRDGPAVVLAGPGSGKTFVITERILYLIEQHRISPSQILTITFTRQAAVQMRRRFLKKTDNRYPEVVFGTFHSVFYRMLRLSHEQGEASSVKIITEKEKRRILRLLLADAHATDPSIVPSTDLLEQILSEISRIKGSGDPGEWEKATKGDNGHGEPPCGRHFPAIFAGYERMLRELDLMDFDDILVRCLRMLESEPETLALWRARFPYLLIDEYQDINRVQFRIVKFLSAPAHHLFVVGDDDQSIYGFRGSDPSFMLHFKDEFPDAQVFALDVNYRCRKAILDASLKVIGENTHRFHKVIRAGRTDEAGEVLDLTFQTKEEEQRAILAFLKERRDLNDTAVIVRTNAQAAVLTDLIRASGLAVCAPAKADNFYETGEVADVLAYLRLAGTQPRQEDFYRVMNRPLRYLSRECVRSEHFAVEEALAYYRDRPAMLFKVRKLDRELKMLRGLRPSLAIRYIRSQIGYERYLAESREYGDHGVSMARLDRLQQEAEAFPQTALFLNAVSDRQNAASEDQARERNGAEGVHILTMHAAKGLEFDAVWLPGINEGTIPARKSVLPMQIEEERRLFYVAMTRARRTLILSRLTGSDNYVCAPSRFLRPLLKDVRPATADGCKGPAPVL
ncbi:MAG: ATP-dependent helicase [Lachnospiraceae bacterium]|nr:ATP-dependent helicase [Lachnospiraceae bacterium]